MTLRRTEIRLSVERDLPGSDGARRARLEARLEPDRPDAPLAPEEVRAALAALSAELDLALGPIAGAKEGRPERSLAELVEAYHPRQAELIELLREEGEITAGESVVLERFLAERAPLPPAPFVGGVPVVERPIAAAPLAGDRSPEVARPVRELLTLYRIESLKQAGAVRARRQISYEEYMALKRHFAEPEAAGAAGTPAGPS